LDDLRKEERMPLEAARDQRINIYLAVARNLEN
jgi:hypothetical protein